MPELEDDKIGPLDVEEVKAPKVYMVGRSSQLKRKLGETSEYTIKTCAHTQTE